MKILIFLALLFSAGAFAQNPVQFQPTTTDPTGRTCNSTQGNLRTPNGILYTCKNGAIAAVNGSGTPGTVTSVSGTTSEIDVATGTTTPVISLNAAAINDTIAYCPDAGASDAYACSTPISIAYITGARYRFKANTANTGAATINFNSLGAKTIVKVAGGITTALADNDIRVGQVVDLVYDGTNMQMQSTLGNASSGGASPAGSLGSIQLYATSSTFGSDAAFNFYSSPTGNGQVGLSVGQLEPDLSAINGQSVAISLVQDVANGRSIFNQVVAGGIPQHTYYFSGGTVASPTDAGAGAYGKDEDVAMWNTTNFGGYGYVVSHRMGYALDVSTNNTTLAGFSDWINYGPSQTPVGYMRFGGGGNFGLGLTNVSTPLFSLHPISNAIVALTNWNWVNAPLDAELQLGTVTMSGSTFKLNGLTCQVTTVATVTGVLRCT